MVFLEQCVTLSCIGALCGSFEHIARVTYAVPLEGVTTIVKPKLALQRSVPPLVILADGVTVTYEVKNAGTGVAREVVIEETLPAGFVLDEGVSKPKRWVFCT